MNNSYLIIETISPNMGVSKKIIPIKEAIRLHIAKNGEIEIIKEENKCKTCNGSGRRRYHWYQDKTTEVKCPTCNNGDQDKWDKEKELWDKSK